MCAACGQSHARTQTVDAFVPAYVCTHPGRRVVARVHALSCKPFGGARCCVRACVSWQAFLHGFSLLERPPPAGSVTLAFYLSPVVLSRPTDQAYSSIALASRRLRASQFMALAPACCCASTLTLCETPTGTHSSCTPACVRRQSVVRVRGLEEEVEELNTRLIMWQHNQGHDPMTVRSNDDDGSLSPDKVGPKAVQGSKRGSQGVARWAPRWCKGYAKALPGGRQGHARWQGGLPRRCEVGA